MTEETTPVRRPVLAVRRLLATLISRLRSAFGGLFAVLFHGQLRDLKSQTQRLGAASVESMTYVGGQLQALDERLTRIEEELAAVRAVLEESDRARQERAEPDQVSQPSG
jgi:hypothetical protein